MQSAVFPLGVRDLQREPGLWGDCRREIYVSHICICAALLNVADHLVQIFSDSELKGFIHFYLPG